MNFLLAVHKNEVFSGIASSLQIAAKIVAKNRQRKRALSL